PRPARSTLSLQRRSSDLGVQEAARWMQALAPAAQRSAQSQNDLPDPQILWLRAQLSERQAAAERAQKVLRWVEVACVMAACAGLDRKSTRLNSSHGSISY